MAEESPAVDPLVETLSTVVRDRWRAQPRRRAKPDSAQSRGIGWLPDQQPPCPPPGPETWFAPDTDAEPEPAAPESDLERAVRARGELDMQRTKAEQDIRDVARQIAAAATALADGETPVTADQAATILELAGRLLRTAEHSAVLDHALWSVYGPAGARSRT